jgi:hypothetical protein
MLIPLVDFSQSQTVQENSKKELDFQIGLHCTSRVPKKLYIKFKNQLNFLNKITNFKI